MLKPLKSSSNIIANGVQQVLFYRVLEDLKHQDIDGNVDASTRFGLKS
jgi:hypothetical protein